MKIYLAARFSRKDEMKQVRFALQQQGHTVTSSWLDTEWKDTGHGMPAPPEYREKWAAKDLADVDAADVVVSFTESPDCKHGRGGRHVEFGYALAKGKRCIVVGPMENVFHRSKGVEQTDNLFRLYDLLRDTPVFPIPEERKAVCLTDEDVSKVLNVVLDSRTQYHVAHSILRQLYNYGRSRGIREGSD